MLVFIATVPNSVKIVLTEEEIFLMNDFFFFNAAPDSYSIFVILCILTFSQKKQKDCVSE